MKHGIKLIIGMTIMLVYQAAHAQPDYLAKAATAQKSGDSTRAVMYYHLALRDNPSDVETELKLAQLYLARGQNDKAKKHTQQVLQNSPDHTQALLTLARIYERQGNRPEECSIYARILTTSSTTPEAHLGMGKCMQERGDETAATEAFNHYKTLTSGATQ